MRYFLAFLLALVALPSAAQSYKTNCVTTACTFVSDPYAADDVQPTSCVLVINGVDADEAPVAGPAGAVYCSVPRKLAAGTYTITMRGKNADGVSDPSAAISVMSTRGVPQPPKNLRISGVPAQALRVK